MRSSRMYVASRILVQKDSSTPEGVRELKLEGPVSSSAARRALAAALCSVHSRSTSKTRSASSRNCVWRGAPPPSNFNLGSVPNFNLGSVPSPFPSPRAAA